MNILPVLQMICLKNAHVRLQGSEETQTFRDPTCTTEKNPMQVFAKS